MWRIYLAVALLAGIVGTALSLYALLDRETAGAAPLSLFVLAAAMWSITEGLSLANDTVAGTVFWARLGLSITTIVPLAWLLIAVEYTGHDRELDGHHLLALLVEPIAFVALVWTNAGHGLVWADVDVVVLGEYAGATVARAPALWAHVVYSYLLIAAGAFLLVRVLVRADDPYRAQTTALLGAIAAPSLVYALVLFGLTPPGVDPTGIAFVGSGAVIAVAILRRQLLAVAVGTREIGREAIVTELDDPVLIVDAERAIVDHNRAAGDLLDVSDGGAFGRPLREVAPTLAKVLPEDDRSLQRVTRIEHDGSVREYDLRVTPLERPFGAAGGLLVSLRDVTERARREQQLDVLNRLLRHNIRNEMNVVRGHAELLGESLSDPDSRERIDRILGTVDTVAERSEKVGRLTRAFEAETTAIDLEVVLRDAIASVSRAYPEATIELEGDAAVEVTGALSLGVAFEELLENAVEHGGDPASVVVSVRPTSTDVVTVRVSDDGPGIDQQERAVIERGRETALEHGSGVGLWLVAWLVRTHGGTIDFEVDDGTTVIVRLPRVDDGGPQTSAS